MNQTGFSVTLLQKRLLSLFLTITFLFVVILGRFFYVQVVWGDKLVQKATDQWNREIPVVAARGNILDANGNILVGNQSTYSIFLRPNAVINFEYTAQVLSEIFNLDYAKTLQKISKKRVSEVTVARHVTKQSVEKLLQYALNGVYYARDNTRTYAYNDTLCQVLGFTSYDGVGVSGLEKYYQNALGGQNGEISYTTDIVGVETENPVILYTPATDGNSIQLTVDLDIQLICERAVREVYEQTNAKAASCILIDPQTFGVLAMVNYPSYDLNEIPRDDIDALNALTRNTVVSNIYEPGSTFKIITAAANLEEYYGGNQKAYAPNRIFNGSRTRQVDGTTVKCWSNHANGKHANQTLAEALNTSCNPCFTDMALALGSDTFYDYLRAFGFGSRTGIDFSGEAQGMLVSQKTVRNADLARIGFGQSVAVTALQLTCACAAAVNGGNYYTPHFVKSVISADGKRQNAEIAKKSAPISIRASQTLATMLEGVVREGSGSKAYIEGYRVGGKTGTAQKYENGAIAAGKYVSSFIGFFPANQPKYLALITVDEPQGAYYGSVVAAPVAKNIFENIIAAKNIPPFE